MNSIRRFFSIFPATNITNSDKVLFVGRWSVPHSTKVHIDQIIDRNNEDHCGVCVSYENDMKEIEKNNINNDINDINDNNNDKYYLAFIM